MPSNAQSHCAFEEATSHCGSFIAGGKKMAFSKQNLGKTRQGHLKNCWKRCCCVFSERRHGWKSC